MSQEFDLGEKEIDPGDRRVRGLWVLEAATKLLKAYRDELPEDALKILAKACGLPGPPTKEKDDPGDGEGGEAIKGSSFQKGDLEKMDPKTRTLIEKLLDDRRSASRGRRVQAHCQGRMRRCSKSTCQGRRAQHLPIQPLKFGPIMNMKT